MTAIGYRRLRVHGRDVVTIEICGIGTVQHEMYQRLAPASTGIAK